MSDFAVGHLVQINNLGNPDEWRLAVVMSIAAYAPFELLVEFINTPMAPLQAFDRSAVDHVLWHGAPIRVGGIAI